MSERTCKVCGCDIGSLHPNRKICFSVDCVKGAKLRYESNRSKRADHKRKPSEIRNGATYGHRETSGRPGAYMPVQHALSKGKIQTGHAGTNIDRAALDDDRDWQRLTGGRKIEKMNPANVNPVHCKSFRESMSIFHGALKRKGGKMV